ncbi:hypothetical protein GCM10009118_19410 [Wandonia haliotis]|uniref:GP-PDE domain-containing protein n=1 Tax=Wandonia haliotis TaxID=574963 RepID=A0ABN1MQC6_9FLAO
MRFNRYILFLFIFLFSCKKSETGEKYTALIIGHAGAGLHVDLHSFPDNSSEAIAHAIYSGVVAVEIDVQMTIDHQLVAFHDNYLDSRTTYTGCIGSTTWEELSSVAYSLYPGYSPEKLNEIDFFGCQQVFLDLKFFNHCTEESVSYEMIKTVLSDFISSSALPQVVLISTNSSLLAYLSDLPVHLAYEEVDYTKLKNQVVIHEIEYCVIRNSKITKEQVDELQALGKKVIIFDAKSFEGNQTVLKKKPDYLMTDDLVSALSLTK